MPINASTIIGFWKGLKPPLFPNHWAKLIHTGSAGSVMGGEIRTTLPRSTSSSQEAQLPPVIMHHGSRSALRFTCCRLPEHSV